MQHQEKKATRLQMANLKAQTKALSQAHKDSDIKEFRSQLIRLLPHLKHYILRRLNMAHSTGAMYSKELSAREILDTVYLRLYEKFPESPPDPNKMETFVYRVADEVLANELDEKAYEKKIFVNVNHLLDRELLDLEEKFTVDAEGELIMTDELDDVSYHKLYKLSSVLPEDEEAVPAIEKALLEHDKRLIHGEIRRQLIKLPEEQRTVFDLFWLEEMDLEQISEIRNLTVLETEDILKNVTLRVKEGLEKKFGSR